MTPSCSNGVHLMLLSPLSGFSHHLYSSFSSAASSSSIVFAFPFLTGVDSVLILSFELDDGVLTPLVAFLLTDFFDLARGVSSSLSESSLALLFFEALLSSARIFFAVWDAFFSIFCFCFASFLAIGIS